MKYAIPIQPTPVKILRSMSKKPPDDSPFAALAGLRDSLPAGPAPTEAAPPAVPKREAKPPARAVARYERSGRKGKEATVIEKLGLAEGELAEWCQALKRALGCGGTVEGDRIVLQGDQRHRIAVLLEQRGVRKVTVS